MTERCDTADLNRMGEIRVETYSGFKTDQRPVTFVLGQRTYRVLNVEDQWYGPSAMHFRVRADDGNVYVLCHHEAEQRWTLDAFRSAR
jgi:hypothetical protein